MDIILACVSVWAVAIAANDIWRRKVPNALLLLVLIPAVLALVFLGHGLLGVGVKSSWAGFLVAIGFSLPGYMLNQMGAGDVKLAALLGLLSGAPGVFYWLLYAALTLGAMALVAILARRLADKKWKKMPAAVALVAGFLGYVYWGKVGFI